MTSKLLLRSIPASFFLKAVSATRLPPTKTQSFPVRSQVCGGLDWTGLDSPSITEFVILTVMTADWSDITPSLRQEYTVR